MSSPLVPLTLADVPEVQKLFEACTDYFVFSDGVPPAPHAARDEFDALPPGMPPEAKQVFGTRNAQGDLEGMLESVRGYPRPEAWWIGLMLVAPGLRCRGLGSTMLAEFESLARQRGITELRLCVFDDNPAARQFWERNGFGFQRVIPAQQFGVKVHARTELVKWLPRSNASSW